MSLYVLVIAGFSLTMAVHRYSFKVGLQGIMYIVGLVAAMGCLQPECPTCGTAWCSAHTGLNCL